MRLNAGVDEDNSQKPWRPGGELDFPVPRPMETVVICVTQ